MINLVKFITNKLSFRKKLLQSSKSLIFPRVSLEKKITSARVRFFKSLIFKNLNHERTNLFTF